MNEEKSMLRGDASGAYGDDYEGTEKTTKRLLWIGNAN